MGNYIFHISLSHYLFLAVFLFFIGAVGTIISRNMIKILLCLEFMLTAININMIAFSSYIDNVKLNGFVFALFYAAIGAVEVAIALIIIYLMYRDKKSIDIEKYKELKR